MFSISEGWFWFFLSLIYYKIFVGILGNQIAQHRYFSHRSFETSNFKHKILLLGSCLTGISPIVYAALHRSHHIHSDTELDPHSPRKSIFHSIFGWQFLKISNIQFPRDLFKQNDTLIIHKFGSILFFIFFILLSIINWKIAVFLLMAGIGWNYLHMGIIRSTLVHCRLPFSYKNFDINDSSWNNKIIQIIDIGEGLHNNHHMYPKKYNQAVKLNEVDPVGWIIKKVFAK
jgi:stearoyl-CoA desaturase (delta-9 desaturase)